MKFAAFLFTLGLAASAQAADNSADQVLECVRSNVPSSLRVQHVDLLNTDRAGNSNAISGSLFALRESKGDAKGQIRVSLRVAEPANMAGSAFLIREAANAEPAMYVYLPAVRRVRRVSGEFADGQLLGSNFSYADFRHFQGVFDKVSAKLEAPATLDNRPAYVLSFSEMPDSRYGRVRLWVDQKSCVPLKLAFYQNHELVKELTTPADALKQVQNYWYPGEVLMRDLRSGTQSKLVVRRVEMGVPMPGKLFSPTLFYR